MSDEVRMIDANLLKGYLIEGDGDDEFTEGYNFAINEIRELIDKRPTIEAEPMKQVTELSSILQDYGIKDTDTLRYILDQYQKIIVDITGGQMSYLTYPAETVIACADDNYRKCHEESMKHGRWEYYRNNGITNTYICTNCQGKVEMAIDVNPNEFKFCPSCNARMDGDSK